MLYYFFSHNIEYNMTSPIKEQDFDFLKNTSSSFLTNYNKGYFSKKLKLHSFIIGFLFVFSSIYFINNSQSHYDHQSSVVTTEQPLLTFKSLSPASFSIIEQSLKDIFSLNSAFYTDNSSVRRGLIDTKLDTVQGNLLKQIHSSINMKNVNKFMSVDSKIHHISVISFDSSIKKMIVEVQYSATFKYKNNDNMNVESSSSNFKQYVSLSLDKHSNISEINLLNHIKNKSLALG